MADVINTWWCFSTARVRSELQYPASFALSLTAQFLANAVELIGVWAVFHTTRTVGGWTADQVMWLYAVSTSAFGIADVLVSAIEELAEHIRTGKFDSYLLRPSPLLTSLLADGFELRRLGRFAPGLLCLLAMPVRPDWFGIERSVRDLGSTALVVAVGACIYGALFVATNSVSFWVVDARETANAFTYGGSAAAKYPMDVLAVWIRRLFVWVVPVGFVAWLPGSRVLHAPPPGWLPPWMAYAGPLAAVLTVAAASLTWHRGVRRYESTGS